MTARTAAQAAQDLQDRTPMQIHLEALKLLAEIANTKTSDLRNVQRIRHRVRAWLEAEGFPQDGG